ncbi:MAG: hypothetical protein AMXMBFR83_17170 [Phycisphaerae bacterium]
MNRACMNQMPAAKKWMMMRCWRGKGRRLFRGVAGDASACVLNLREPTGWKPAPDGFQDEL